MSFVSDDGAAWIEASAAAAFPVWGDEPEGAEVTDEPINITIQKIGYSLPISCCLTDAVECDHPTAPKLSRRRRLRWWLRDRWDRRPRVHFGPCDHEDCW